MSSASAQSHAAGENVSQQSAMADEGQLYYQDLLHAIERLHEENHRRHAAIAGAVHDLKTPLAIISGYLNLLLASKLGPINERQLQAMQDMAGSCKRLDHAIAKLLAYGATAANKVKLSVEIGDLTLAMRRAASMWAPTFEGKGIRFEYQIPEDPIRFAFDRQKIGQVVSNLLENASHFTPSGGKVSLVVRQQFWERRSTQSRPPGAERRMRNVVAPNAAFIAVSDTGTGIAPEYHQEIFEDFFSMATDTVPQGTGLGLSIARYLVQAHGGKIWVESKSGEGASFFVLLPFAMPEPRAANPPSVPAENK